MRIAGEVSARRIGSDAGAAPPTSEILLDGAPTGAIVSGALLEAAVHADGRWLLFMTDDSPFEEMLSIHLLDDSWRLLDSAVLGGAYSTGSFSALRLVPPGTAHFHFIGDADWSVEILPRAGFRVPFLADASGVSRKLGFSRHFVVRGKPSPQRR